MTAMGMMKRLVRAVLPRSVRNWVRQPAKTVQWAWADIRARVGLTDRLELRPGWVIRSHPGAYYLAYHVQMDDPEQVAEFDQFVRYCTPGMVLFDIGAHFGLFSLAAIHYGTSTAKAIAVDPSPLAARVVRFQAQANGVADRLRMVQAPAGDGSGHQMLVAAGIGSAGFFVLPAADHPPSEQIVLETVSIDSLVEATGLTPTHIKIDVEGFELGVLHGGVKTFGSTNPPLLFLELHNEFIRSSGNDPRNCLDLITDWGFELHNVTGKRITTEDALAPPIIRLLIAQPGVV